MAGWCAGTEIHLPDRIASSAARSAAFARVTTLAAAVVAATGVLDLVTGSVNLSTAWTCLVIALSLAIAAMPMLLGNRFHPLAGLAGCWAFTAITALQVAAGGDAIMAVNNLVLYPMISCYLGWFFRPGIARTTVAAQFAVSAAALMTTDHHEVFRTWANLALASYFCLEVALYLRAKLDQQIESDPLTGALNRTGLTTQLRREMAVAGRTGAPLALAAIDLDDFKETNDRLGHFAGDQALTAVVAHLKRSLRVQDTIARTGGDEFVVLLPDTPAAVAAATLRRVRVDSSTPWTFGLAVLGPADTPETLMARADDDLYVQKRRRAEISRAD
ncbi:MAG: hypothetical protein JWQ91_454 [Aeromicrobium sp.]|nr:hypothetical protein [Aeromicrobium sp.]